MKLKLIVREEGKKRKVTSKREGTCAVGREESKTVEKRGKRKLEYKLKYSFE